MKRTRPGMGRIPGPGPHVAVVYPFLQEVPLGRWTELPGDEGYRTSMPSSLRGCKGVAPDEIAKALEGVAQRGGARIPQES
jgi:hypothetical protein